MRRRKRLRKKLHHRFLDFVVGDISMAPDWRTKLLAAGLDESFEIPPSGLPGLDPTVYAS